MKYLNRYGFMAILILLALFFPQSLTNHAKLTMRVIITGFAVDKLESNLYEVTAQAVIPSPSIQGGSGEAKIDFISEDGKSISDCINKIAYKIVHKPRLDMPDELKTYIEQMKNFVLYN